MGHARWTDPRRPAVFAAFFRLAPLSGDAFLNGMEGEIENGLRPARLEWRDGVPLSFEFQDIYYSLQGGMRESRHVFLRNNDLARRFRARGDSFHLCEQGFGTGLNFLLTRRLFLRLAPASRRLIYFSLEKHPLEKIDLRRALAPFAGTRFDGEEFAERMPPPVPGFHRLSFDGDRVVLILYYGDVARGLAELEVAGEPSRGMHAWFLDGFAPARNPEMWTPEIFAHMARLSAPGATLATFTAASAVRRGLEDAGFRVEKTRGFGRKRDMLRGVMDRSRPRTKTGVEARDARALRAPWYARSSSSGAKTESARAGSAHAIIVGAGLAGTSAAFALARRGLRVIVLERGPGPAAGASGTAAGIMLPVLSARPSPFSRYSCQAYLHILRRLERLGRRGELWDRPGLIQLYNNEANRERLEKALANLELPREFVRGVDQGEASELAGMEIASGGLYFPDGAWVDTPELCRANLEHENIETRFNHGAASIVREGREWFIRDEESRLLACAPVLILAAALDCGRFAETARLPLVSVRGQLFSMPSTPASRALRAIVCYDGYVLPDRHGHVVGATFELDNRDPAPHGDLNRGLYQALTRNVPGMESALARRESETAEFDARLDELPARVGFRAATRDRFPIIGPVPDHGAFAREYGDISLRSHRTRDTYGEDYPPGPAIPGLYVSTGHGSRGLIYTALGGEYLASLILGEPSPIPRDIGEALHPGRFLIRKLKTGPLASGPAS